MMVNIDINKGPPVLNNSNIDFMFLISQQVSEFFLGYYKSFDTLNISKSP